MADKVLFIEDSVVTIDAMGYQKSIAEKIIDKKADYLLAVKTIISCCILKLKKSFQI